MTATAPTAALAAAPSPALTALALLALDHAKSRGATAADVEVSTSVGQNVTVRLGELETIEHNRDKGLGITVYVGERRGNASTSDLSREAVERTVEAALAIARHTAPDPWSGLPDATRLARAPFPELGLYTPWNPSVAEATELARRMEAAAFAVDRRINNSEGATLSTAESDFVYANSLGFVGGYPTSRHSASVSVIAGSDDSMQRDYWYETARSANALPEMEQIGATAGQRTVARLGARRAPTGEVPVLFDATIAPSLIGSFVGAVSGTALYRRATFLPDCLGEQVFSPLVSIEEDPFIPTGLASGPFDAEGVGVAPRAVVRDGVVLGWFLSSYSARKLGTQTTGNAGGNHNLTLASGPLDRAGLIRTMRRGFLVTELMGQGVNSVTGDYSRGAVGFWVENGEIAYPVEEITIAGNMKEMFKGIIGIGSDVLALGSKRCGSVLIERMAVAGE